jgi:hypothetical protein
MMPYWKVNQWKNRLSFFFEQKKSSVYQFLFSFFSPINCVEVVIIDGLYNKIILKKKYRVSFIDVFRIVYENISTVIIKCLKQYRSMNDADTFSG